MFTDQELFQQRASASAPRKLKSASPYSPLAKRSVADSVFVAEPVSEKPLADSPNHDSPNRDSSQAGLVQKLQHQIRSLETNSRREGLETVSTGCAALDQILPEQGLARGTIIEWLSESPGSSAATLSLIAARNACDETGGFETGAHSSHQKSSSALISGTLIVVDPQHLFYPPAAAAWGIDLNHTIVLRPQNRSDQNWAVQQSLACSAVAAVWALLEEIDEHAFRRFQLAAEESGCLGLFHRPARMRKQPSWSEIQLIVRAQRLNPQQTLYRGRRLQVQLARCRGGASGKKIELEINEATGTLRAVKALETATAIKGHETRTRRLAAELADSKIGRRQARA